MAEQTISRQAAGEQEGCFRLPGVIDHYVCTRRLRGDVYRSLAAFVNAKYKVACDAGESAEPVCAPSMGLLEKELFSGAGFG